MVLTIGYITITLVSAGLPEHSQPVVMSIVITKVFLLTSPNSHRSSSPYQHPCLLVIGVLKTISSVILFSSYFGFLGHCAPFRKAAGGCPAALVSGTCHENTEHGVPRVQTFLAAQVVQPSGVGGLCSMMEPKATTVATWGPT